MGSGSAYNYIAMKEAILDSGLEDKNISNFKTGIVMGSGGPSIENVILAADKTRAKTPKLMGAICCSKNYGKYCLSNSCSSI